MQIPLEFSQNQTQKQSQKQIQKLSQVQIQALNILAMNSFELKEEIAKALSENPALEVSKKQETRTKEKIKDYGKDGNELEVLGLPRADGRSRSVSVRRAGRMA